MSFFSTVAASSGIGLGTVGAAVAGGALAAVVLSIGGTQVYQNATAPDHVVTSTANVGYADQ
jgi:hypothetical protein